MRNGFGSSTTMSMRRICPRIRTMRRARRRARPRTRTRPWDASMATPTAHATRDWTTRTLLG
eukprot:2261356-Prorocentrum_lima.AAC.1